MTKREAYEKAHTVWMDAIEQHLAYWNQVGSGKSFDLMNPSILMRAEAERAAFRAMARAQKAWMLDGAPIPLSCHVGPLETLLDCLDADMERERRSDISKGEAS